MTRIDAIAEAVDVIDELTKGAVDGGTVEQRAAAVLGVAQFLAGVDVDGRVSLPDADDEDDEDDKPAGVLGAVLTLPCSVSAGDRVDIDAFRGSLGTRVRVGVTEGGRQGTVCLKAGDARRLAAGLLNAADEADGTTPLTFTA